MKVLLTGGAGFAGRHLSAMLSARGHEVFIADRFDPASADASHLVLYLENEESIRTVLQTVKPDCIIHLAAQSSVAQSWKTPESTLEVNIIGSVRLLQVAAQLTPECRFVFIGSGEEYGVDCSEERPFTEESVCRPHNPYAVSKFAAGQMLELLALRYSMRFVHLRPFNHFGPFQREGFVVADFCAQVARAEAGSGSRGPDGEWTIRVGNLEAKRDFLFVDDVMKAYCLMAEAEQYPHPVYNISTGTVHPVRYILDYLVSQAKVGIRVEIDPAKFRPVEVPALIASNELIYKDFGWRPETSLEDGLLKNLNWWRENVR